MGWFSRNRRPFAKAFLERLDRIEAAVESLVDPKTPKPPRLINSYNKMNDSDLPDNRN